MMDDDKDWADAFAPLNAELHPGAFVADVMRGVRRRVWIRGVVIGAACAIGAASAAAPLHDFASVTLRALGTIEVQWRDIGWYMQYGLPVVFLSVVGAWPILARWLAR